MKLKYPADTHKLGMNMQAPNTEKVPDSNQHTPAGVTRQFVPTYQACSCPPTHKTIQIN